MALAIARCQLQSQQHVGMLPPQHTLLHIGRSSTCRCSANVTSCAWPATLERRSFHAQGDALRIKAASRCTLLTAKPKFSCQAAATTTAAASSSLVDLGIVSAAGQASFKLLFLCAVVAMMSERSMIPATASQVMSKVAFNLTIPAMLLVSTTKTLVNCDATNLIGIPIIAVAQIALGALFGRWAAAAVEGKLPITRVLFGWGSLHPTPPAAAIAASTAAALRAPRAAPALLPKSQGYPQGIPQLTQLACAFGNTVTLPLMYLMTMLPAAEASRATGFMSLFHAAWSPCLWVFGYSSIQESGKPRGMRRGFRSQLQVFWRSLAAAIKGSTRSSSPTPPGSSSSSGFSPPSPGQPAVLITKQLPNQGSGPGQAGRAVYAVPGDPEQSPADETPAEMLVKRVWGFITAIMQLGIIQRVTTAINPPVAAVIAGVTLGLSPAGALLSDTAAASAFVGAHTTSAFTAWELSVLLGLLRCCWETVELLASGTLALQAIVLAASLFGPKDGAAGSSSSSRSNPSSGDIASGKVEGMPGIQKGTVEVESPAGEKVEVEGLARTTDLGVSSGFSSSSSSSSTGFGSSYALQMGSSSSSSSAGDYGQRVQPGINITHLTANTADDASNSVLSQLAPQNAWEWRTMLAVAVVRFVLLPCATTALVITALRMGLLLPEPACAFMLLLQSCMPPAQNLVLMMQLQPSTAELAPATARLLLQLYTLAVVPVTLWVSVFAKLVM